MSDEDAILKSMQNLIDDLRRYARGMLRRTSADLTLEATDLVNMAWLKLHSNGHLDLSSPRAVFPLYVTAMKSQLRDYLRTRQRKKRGGPERHRESIEFLNQLAAADMDPLQLIDQLDELGAMGEERQAAAVAGRIFYSLTNAELAEQLGVSVKTVEEDLRKARAWLKNRHTPPVPDSPMP